MINDTKKFAWNFASWTKFGPTLNALASLDANAQVWGIRRRRRRRFEWSQIKPQIELGATVIEI